MRVALVHDFLVEYGGAERVLEALHEIWPKATVFTALYDKNGPGMKKFSSWQIKTSWLQNLPFNRILLSPMRLFSLVFFESFDFSDFDLVISSTWMYMAKGVITKPETLHLCYLHTPPRFLYGYKTAKDWRRYWWGRFFGGILNHKMRMIDFLASQRPDYLIANSKFTAERIWKFYRRKAAIIYPPVKLASINRQLLSPKRQNYFLCVSRLARAKRIDLAIRTCNQLNLDLWIVGSGREKKYLKSIAGPKIKFLGHLSDQKLAEVYNNCQALIFPAEDEDFGIVPVEAMSFGKPVIALKSGGVKETVVEGKTGVFFDEPTVENLIKAIKKFQGLTISPTDCLKQAKKFSKKRFQREIKKFVKEKLKEKQTENKKINRQSD